MAEFIFKKLVEEAGCASQFEIASAATSTEELGNPVYPPARRKLADYGISCTGKIARQITHDDYSHYDLLIGMDAYNIRNMLRFFGGDPEGKIHLLMSFAGHDADVADPWYTGDFSSTYRDCLTGCQALLSQYCPIF